MSENGSNGNPWGLPGIPNLPGMIPSTPWDLSAAMPPPGLNLAAFPQGSADGQMMPMVPGLAPVKEEDIAAAVAQAMASVGGPEGVGAPAAPAPCAGAVKEEEDPDFAYAMDDVDDDDDDEGDDDEEFTSAGGSAKKGAGGGRGARLSGGGSGGAGLPSGGRGGPGRGRGGWGRGGGRHRKPQARVISNPEARATVRQLAAAEGVDVEADKVRTRWHAIGVAQVLEGQRCGVPAGTHAWHCPSCMARTCWVVWRAGEHGGRAAARAHMYMA